MWLRIWKYSIFIRVVTLAMGCSSAAPLHQSTTAPSAGMASRDFTYSSRREPESSSGGGDDSMKGKGSHTEAESKNVTANRMKKWDVTAEKVQAVAALVEEGAQKNSIPASLIYGVIWVESRFNPEAVSPVGARGLMQLMPKTAAYLADCIKWEGDVDSFDPAFNIAAGSYYVAKLIRQFDGDIDLALAAYNAGPTNIRRWMGNTGLPEVSIEYYTMVQTAQNYFPTNASSGGQDESVIPSTEELDRLGLTILIAGLSKRDFGLERPDSENPFESITAAPIQISPPTQSVNSVQ